MSRPFDRFVFDLDDTLIASGAFRPQQDAAGRNPSLRPAFHDLVARMGECPGASALVKDLAGSGKTVVVLTNAWRDYAVRAVRHLGLERHVSEIVAAAGKPRKGSLAALRDKYDSANAGARMVHAGDSAAKDLRESVAANVSFVLCLWGDLRGVRHVPAPDERAVLLGQAKDVPELRNFLIK